MRPRYRHRTPAAPSGCSRRARETHDTTASPARPARETHGTTAGEKCTKTAVSHRRWCQRFHNEENPHQQRRFRFHNEENPHQQRRFRFQNEHNPRHHCQPRPAHTQNPRHHCRPRPAHTRNPRHHCQRKMHQKQPFLTDNGANGFTTSKTRTNRGASGFTTRKTRTNRGASGFRQPVDRRLECGAWPGFETTLRAKLAARTAEAGGPPPRCTPSSDTKQRHQAATPRGDTSLRPQIWRASKRRRNTGRKNPYSPRNALIAGISRTACTRPARYVASRRSRRDSVLLIHRLSGANT